MIENIKLEDLPDFISINGQEIKPRLDYDSIDWLDNYFRKIGEKSTGVSLILSLGASGRNGIMRAVDQLRIIWLSVRDELGGITFDQFKQIVNNEKWSLTKTGENVAIALKTSFLLELKKTGSETEEDTEKKKNGPPQATTDKPLESGSGQQSSGN